MHLHEASRIFTLLRSEPGGTGRQLIGIGRFLTFLSALQSNLFETGLVW